MTTILGASVPLTISSQHDPLPAIPAATPTIRKIANELDSPTFLQSDTALLKKSNSSSYTHRASPVSTVELHLPKASPPKNKRSSDLFEKSQQESKSSSQAKGDSPVSLIKLDWPSLPSQSSRENKDMNDSEPIQPAQRTPRSPHTELAT